MTSAEQYLLELINRARLDPVGEAWRYGIELNQGLQPGQLDDGARQALAPNALLSAAAAAHSRWMLEADHFSHTGAGGSTAGERMEAAGYVFSGAWSWGENLALSMSTASISLEAAIARHHEGLFLSPGHRENLLGARFSELGIGQEAGRFTDGRTYNASMLTENFARSGSATFLTGVVYADDDDDGFYSMGEGAGGLTVRSAALQSAVASAGGYALGLSAAGRVEAAFVGEGMPEVRFAVDLSAGNAKVDLVDGAHLKSSANLTLLAGATTATLLGVADLELTGSAASERLVGNAGANYLSGGGGDDILVGGAGDDVLDGGEGFDVAEYAGYSADFVVTRTAEGYLVSSARFGTDTLLGIERLAFFDQTLPVAQAAHNTASIGHAVGGAVGGADGGQRDTALFLQQQFGLSLAEARGWVMERLEAPWEIYDVCASNTVTSAMLADVVRAGFPEVIITGVVVNEWLNAQGMPALA